MLYEEYEAKLEKEQSKRAHLFHFRFLILFSLLTIIAIVLSLLATKGIVTDSKIAAKTYTYGEKISYSGSAFMSNCEYEFASQGEKNWSEEIPSKPGNYLLRPKARNGFGATYYGQEQSFTILPKKLNISFVTTANIPYGEKAEITADGLTYIDKVADYEVNYDITSSPVASVPLESVQIQNTKGEDVTDCYKITVPTKEAVTFKQRPITLGFLSTSKVYDGKAFDEKDFGYDILGGSLVTGDSITFQDYPSETNASDNVPVPSVVITNKDGIDVTKYYSVKTSTKKFTIQKKRIAIKGKSYSRTYDGTTDIYNDGDSKPVEKIEVDYDSSLLIGDDIIEITPNVSKVSPSVGTYSLPFTAAVKDSNGEDVTSNYDLDITPGTLEVKKRKVTINAGYSGSIEYRGTLSDKDQEVLTNNRLCSADNLASSDELHLSAQYPNADDTSITYTYQILNRKTQEDVSSNYDVTTNFTPVEATKRELSITTGDVTVVYDGQPHTLSELSYDSASLYPGDTIVKGEAPTYTDANSDSNPNYSFSIPFTIQDSTGKDVTSYYNISTTAGKLVIKPRPISITLLANGNSGDYSKVYDGQAIDFTLSDSTDTKDGNSGLLSSLGDEIQANAFPENVYKIGNTTYNNPASDCEVSYSVKILRNKSIDVTSNYAITYKTLHTEIKKRPLVLNFGTITRYYDGDPFPTSHLKAADAVVDSDDYPVTLLGSGLASGDTISFDGMDGSLYSGVSELASGTQSSVSYDLSNLDTSKIKILHGQEDVTDCYDIQSVTGTIQVKRAKLTLAPSEEDFTYDGAEHDLHYVIQENTSDYPTNYIFHSTSVNAKKPGTYSLSSTLYLSKGKSVIDPSEMDITYTSASVSVAKRKATLHIPSYTYYWTGNIVPITTIEDKATADNLADGDKVSLSLTSGASKDVGTYSYADTLSYQILDSSGNDVSDCYDITPDFGTLSIKKMTLVYQAPEDKEITYDGNLTGYSETDFTLVKEQSVAPDNINPTLTLKENNLSDYQFETSISKAEVEYDSFPYSYSSELSTNTLDIVLETKPKVTIKKRDAVVSVKDFTHFQNKKAISAQEVALHLTSENLATDDMLVLTSKTDANGNIIDAPSTEGTYLLSDYFTLSVYHEENGSDRTKYYRFIDSLTSETPTEVLNLGKVTIKKVSLNVTFLHKSGGYSSNISLLPWSDYCSVTFPNGEDLSLDVTLGFTDYPDGTVLPSSGDYTYGIQEIDYVDLEDGGYNSLTTDDFDIHYVGEEKGTYTLIKTDITLDVTLPIVTGNEETFFGQGISAINKDLFTIAVTGNDDITLAVKDNLTGDYVSVGEHQLTGDDFTFEATDKVSGKTFNPASYFNITVHAPKYKVIPLTLSLDRVANRRPYNGALSTQLGITSHGKLLFYDGDEEVSSKLTDYPKIRSIYANFVFDSNQQTATASDIILAVIDSLNNITTYELSDGTLTIKDNGKDNVTMTIAKKQLTIKFRNLSVSCNINQEYDVTIDNFLITGLTEGDQVLLDSAPYFSYSPNGYPNSNEFNTTIDPSTLSFRIVNGNGVDVTGYYDITYQSGSLTIYYTRDRHPSDWDKEDSSITAPTEP